MLRGVIQVVLLLFLLTCFTACTRPPEKKAAAGDEPETFTIDQVQPKVLPYVFTDQGTWIVKPVQTRPADKEKALNALKRAQETVSKRLKPFPTYNGEENIVPRIKITPISISKQGRTVNTLGWFDAEFNAIVLTWDITTVGDEALLYAFSHELGHWVWFYVLSDWEKDGYRAILYSNTNTEHRNDLKDPGVDQDLLEQEWFADDFRIYACAVPDFPHLLHTSPVKSPGEPAKLQAFFNRFRNRDIPLGNAGAAHNLFPEVSGLNAAER